MHKAARFYNLEDGPDLSSVVPSHLHLGYKWLQNPCDKKQRKRDHPDYDATTLHVPESFLKEQTPAQHQWWKLKSQHFDTVLFFKMGKFYELFHMDAGEATNAIYFFLKRIINLQFKLNKHI